MSVLRCVTKSPQGEDYSRQQLRKIQSSRYNSTESGYLAKNVRLEDKPRSAYVSRANLRLFVMRCFLLLATPDLLRCTIASSYACRPTGTPEIMLLAASTYVPSVMAITPQQFELSATRHLMRPTTAPSHAGTIVVFVPHNCAPVKLYTGQIGGTQTMAVFPSDCAFIAHRLSPLVFSEQPSLLQTVSKCAACEANNCALSCRHAIIFVAKNDTLVKLQNSIICDSNAVITVPSERTLLGPHSRPLAKRIQAITVQDATLQSVIVTVALDALMFAPLLPDTVYLSSSKLLSSPGLVICILYRQFPLNVLSLHSCSLKSCTQAITF